MMRWKLSDVGKVQRMRFVLGDGQPMDLSGSPTVTLELVPAAQPRAAVTSLGCAVVSVDGRASYTRQASDITSEGNYRARGKKTTGASDVQISEWEDLLVEL